MKSVLAKNLLFMVVSGSSIAASPALANHLICNKSAEEIDLALVTGAQCDNDESSNCIYSDGWYYVKPGDCYDVDKVTTDPQFIYVRGEGYNGSIWDGESLGADRQKRFCINRNSEHGFSYESIMGGVNGPADNPEACAAQGGVMETFFNILNAERFELTGGSK